MIEKNFGKRLTRCVDATRASFFQGTAPRSTAPAIARRILRSGEPDLFEHAYPFAYGQSIRFLRIGALAGTIFGANDPSSVWSTFCERESIWTDSISMSLRSMILSQFLEQILMIRHSSKKMLRLAHFITFSVIANWSRLQEVVRQRKSEGDTNVCDSPKYWQ